MIYRGRKEGRRVREAVVISGWYVSWQIKKNNEAFVNFSFYFFFPLALIQSVVTGWLLTIVTLLLLY